MSSPVEIVDSISVLVEVNNSTIELYLPVETSSPVEALNLLVEVNNSTSNLHLPVEAKEKPCNR